MMRENPRERPILFSGPMVHALLDGRKTVTRRIVRERAGCRIDVRSDGVPVYVTRASDDGGEPIPCPYGKRGDRLWVKETWRPRPSLDVEGIPDGAGVSVQYAADGAEVFVDERRIPDTWTMPKSATHGNVSSLLMPRWASRILLEITGVRVERLQAITEDDVRAEGVTAAAVAALLGRDPPADAGPLDLWQLGWDAINGDRAPWSSNPWVWRIAFRRIKP
jgi:hypothetical protein